MKRFNFNNKPIVESPYPPQDTHVLWVDVDETTGKVGEIKRYRNGIWESWLQSVGNGGNVYPEYFMITSLEDGNEISFGDKTYSVYLNDFSAIKNGVKQDISLPIVLNAGDQLQLEYDEYVDDTIISNVLTGVFSLFNATKKIKLSGTVKPLKLTMDGFVVCVFSGFFKNLKIENLDDLNIPLAAYYNSMFTNCSELKSSGINKILDVETPFGVMTPFCYQMFSGCTSLEVAPELPGTALPEMGYMYMFYGCSSLKEAPELPATTLIRHCYAYMFQGCTSLTKAPVLPATILADQCYQGMFLLCTSLKEITCLATDFSPELCVSYWIDDSSTGTFYKNPLTTEETISSIIPSSWTIQDYIG